MRDDIAQLAEQQDGAVSRADLVALGLTRGQIDGLLRTRSIKRVAPSVFVVVGSPATHRQQLQVGLLALGVRSWVSFEAAAALHGLDRSPDAAVEFTVLRGERKRALDATVHSSRWMPQRDQVVVNGIRATSATRTILDLALARCTRSRLEAAIDSANRTPGSPAASVYKPNRMYSFFSKYK